MRLKLIAITAILMICLQALASAETGPKITFDRESYDYGRVLYGDTVSQEFFITNRGDKTLTINRVDASCGCTKAVKGDSEIPPNGRSKIIAAFDTIGLKGGKKEKHLEVFSNDPTRPVVKLTLYADVVRDLHVMPPNISARIKKFSENITFPMVVTNASDKTYAIKAIKTKPGSPEPKLTPLPVVVGPKATVEYRLSLKLENEPGRKRWASHIILETDHPREREIDVSYYIDLEADK